MLKLTNTVFEASYLGLVPFNQAFEIQRTLWLSAKDKNHVSIVGLQHPAVITLGRRAPDLTPTCGLPIVRTTRGGLATIHSEGQLVIYPVMNLRALKLGVKEFVGKLLRLTQRSLAEFDVESTLDRDQVGLYTPHGKIAFCGLEIKEGVSQHGLSINIANDLDLFRHIEPCGHRDARMDRLVNHRSDVDVETFFRVWLSHVTAPEAMN